MLEYGCYENLLKREYLAENVKLQPYVISITFQEFTKNVRLTFLPVDSAKNRKSHKIISYCMMEVKRIDYDPSKIKLFLPFKIIVN